MAEKVEIKTVQLKGEMIHEVFFHAVGGGGDQMFFIFESGKVLVMPVYRGCPVQAGTVENLKEDLDEFLEQLEKDKEKTLLNLSQTTIQIKEVKKFIESKS